MVEFKPPVGDNDGGIFLLAVVECDRLLKNRPAGEKSLAALGKSFEETTQGLVFERNLSDFKLHGLATQRADPGGPEGVGRMVAEPVNPAVRIQEQQGVGRWGMNSFPLAGNRSL